VSGEPTYELNTRSGPEGLERVHDLLDQVWAAHPDVADDDRVRFALAVAEIAGNIVAHSRSPGFSLRLRGTAERLEAYFEDTGLPCEVDLATVCLPSDPLAESGRGLALARAAVDELDYRRAGDLNRWRIVRRRAG